jgi:hypothetical protein
LASILPDARHRHARAAGHGCRIGAVVEAALEHYRGKRALGFSDCLVLETARKAGHLPLGTFDRDLGKLNGAVRPENLRPRMTTEIRPTRFAVWMHERTGEYYVVGDAGETAIGPFRPHEVLRSWRVANSPSEPVLGIPNYYGHYKPAPLPFPATEWLEVDPDWLPPSVTFHRFPERELELEWISPPAALREEVVALANTNEKWIDLSQATFGQLDKGSLYWGHPRGSVLVCKRPTTGERLAIIEWPPSRQFSELSRG